MNFKYYNEIIDKIVALKQQGIGSRQIANQLNIGKSTVNQYYKFWLEQNNIIDDDTKNGPNVLVLDIETAPILGHVWRLWKQNVGLNQIESDWHLLSYAAKWYDSDEVIYEDQRYQEDITNDYDLLKNLWDLLDKADIVISQNGKNFDIRKIRARMIIHGFKPFSPIKHCDTLEVAKKTFGFTSNKLEYMTSVLCTETVKSKHAKFPGFELWKECLAGNIDAWNEMKAYNIDDVVSLQELYDKLAPWSDRLPNFSLYSNKNKFTCRCGSHRLVESGFAYTEISKFQKYVCEDCGSHYRGRKNLLTKEKRESILTNVREN